MLSHVNMQRLNISKNRLLYLWVKNIWKWRLRQPRSRRSKCPNAIKARMMLVSAVEAAATTAKTPIVVRNRINRFSSPPLDNLLLMLNKRSRSLSIRGTFPRNPPLRRVLDSMESRRLRTFRRRTSDVAVGPNWRQVLLLLLICLLTGHA